MKLLQSCWCFLDLFNAGSFSISLWKHIHRWLITASASDVYSGCDRFSKANSREPWLYPMLALNDVKNGHDGRMIVNIQSYKRRKIVIRLIIHIILQSLVYFCLSTKWFTVTKICCNHHSDCTYCELTTHIQVAWTRNKQRIHDHWDPRDLRWSAATAISKTMQNNITITRK